MKVVSNKDITHSNQRSQRICNGQKIKSQKGDLVILSPKAFYDLYRDPDCATQDRHGVYSRKISPLCPTEYRKQYSQWDQGLSTKLSL